MRRKKASAVAAVMACFAAHTAYAQAPDVVPPKAIHDDGVRYPEQAIHDGISTQTSVVLRLTIDATGLVTDAQLETPYGAGSLGRQG